jgi:preprotein translocase subunit SecA
MQAFLARIFDNNARDVAKLQREVVQRVNALEAETKKITDLAEAFGALRKRVREGGESLDAVLPQAFALIREASIRTLGKRHYDVQLIGGAALAQGRIAEMKTGEGKTLMATLPLALNALSGMGCHLVTTNDYLAKVGAEQMGLIYKELGLSVGLIQSSLSPQERQAAYGCDITYVTNSELGFDYLRDNMSGAREQLVMRAETPLNYAIIDEVDSILIDEARTPLIISGPSEKGTSNYYLIAQVAAQLERGEAVVPGDRNRTEPTGDYTIDEKSKQVHLTEQGIEKCEQLLSIDGLFTTEHMEKGHMITQAIRARELYQRDRDYVISDKKEIMIVDEFTGRLMEGRRYGEGLHQAIEAKENVKIQAENQTMATITYQNFFKLYNKIGGMTGTAKTEEKEFIDLYNADVLVIPTNLPMVRKDQNDVVYRSEIGKFKAVIENVVEKYCAGQPVLVGTISIEKSEFLSRMLAEPSRYAKFIEITRDKIVAGLKDSTLVEAVTALLAKPMSVTLAGVQELGGRLPKNLQEHYQMLELEVRTLENIKKGVPHQVLNAKLHEREADIIAQAGRSKAVTISTNMAGRGTDIQLGGNAEFAAYALLEKSGLSRYDDSVELLVSAVIRDDLETARKHLAQIPQLDEKIIHAIVEIRESCKTDHELVKSLGGLHILGTERHESRRIDNQLRGRAGRQGDPGSSRFFVSFEDDLMRLFANETVIRMLDTLGMDDTVPIEAGMVTRSIETAQKRVEERNFSTRKQLLEFDNVMSKQRELIYAQRREVLLGADETMLETVEGMIGDFVENQVAGHITSADPDEWDLTQLRANLVDAVPSFEGFDFEHLRDKKLPEIKKLALEQVAEAYETREKELPPGLLRQLERYVVLQVVDQHWKEHLHAMDVLKQGIFLRGYGQKDPFVEYKFEGTKFFNEMITSLQGEVTKLMFRLQVNVDPPPPPQAVFANESRPNADGGNAAALPAASSNTSNDSSDVGNDSRVRKSESGSRIRMSKPSNSRLGDKKSHK